MVLTCLICKTCASIGSGADTTANASNSSHGADTVVHGDTTRVAVDKHASARSRRTKSNSALQMNISTEDKSAHARTRAAVPKADKGERPIGRKSSQSKNNIVLTVQVIQGQNKIGKPMRTHPNLKLLPERTHDAFDAKLTAQLIGWRNQNRRKRTRIQERCEDAFETTSSRRIRRRICKVASQSNVRIEGRTSRSDTETESSEGTLDGSRSGPSIADKPERFEEDSSSVPSIKNEDINQDWLLVVLHKRHLSVDSMTSAYRESTEPRSSSIESLPTPPLPCMEEEEPNDEADVEAEMAANRYRSLAPDPDQGLVDAIQSGRISGLASPERSMHEE
ncbi:hypothetical protein ACEPAI_1496 [Sanghuangporus weigelae]